MARSAQATRLHRDMSAKCATDHAAFIYNFMETWTPEVGPQAVICTMAGIFAGAVMSCIEVMHEQDPVMADMLRKRCIDHIAGRVEEAP